MREINLDRLRTLLAVADLGSFAAAAQALHLAPPTVTLHVADLERAWARRCCCAAAAGHGHRRGQSLIDRARRLLADADEALDGAPPGAGHRRPRAAGRVHRRHRPPAAAGAAALGSGSTPASTCRRWC
jgi:DNA-binding transcriptional LysR family regulator